MVGPADNQPWDKTYQDEERMRRRRHGDYLADCRVGVGKRGDDNQQQEILLEGMKSLGCGNNWRADSNQHPVERCGVGTCRSLLCRRAVCKFRHVRNA
jgi:hypothetical protein